MNYSRNYSFHWLAQNISHKSKLRFYDIVKFSHSMTSAEEGKSAEERKRWSQLWKMFGHYCYFTVRLCGPRDIASPYMKQAWKDFGKFKNFPKFGKFLGCFS